MSVQDTASIRLNAESLHLAAPHSGKAVLRPVCYILLELQRTSPAPSVS